MFFALITCCILAIPSRVTGTSNWISLYQGANFTDLVFSLRDGQSQTCYNLLCQDVNNVVTSAAWLGWTSKSSDGGLPRITFFMDKDCKGNSRGFKASSGDNYPSNFAADGIDNRITSFIVYDQNVIDLDKTITFCEGSIDR